MMEDGGCSNKKRSEMKRVRKQRVDFAILFTYCLRIFIYPFCPSLAIDSQSLDDRRSTIEGLPRLVVNC